MNEYDELSSKDKQKLIDSDRELAEMSASRSNEGNDDMDTKESNKNTNNIFLIECPACHKSISNHAISCPHCGHPMKTKNTNSSPSASPTASQQKNGIGFWGIVFAVIVALLIMSMG